MTIKELETQVGMTRTVVRFYEQEGLLSPKRLDNGYRDYSQADADTLRKIKLFRQLHLDLETIRGIQSGQLPLPRALEAQLRDLEADQAALDRARQVCQKLRDSGADYAALDPGPWLAELERPPVPHSPRFAPSEDARPSDSVLHPWRRFFARRVDFLLYGVSWTAVYLLAFHWRQSGSVWENLVNSYVAYGLMLLLEPLMLHFWGTTPGKRLFGIKIRDADGRKLTCAAAWRRTWGVFGRGEGYGVPIYNLWRYWRSYKDCESGEGAPWEEDETYTFSDDRGWRCAACAAAYAAALGLTWLISLQALLPPNRGTLTAAEFYENCNFYMDYLGVGGSRRLSEDGAWVEPAPGGAVVVYPVDELRTAYQVTLTGGGVTAVTLTRQAETRDFLWVDNTQQQIALLALAGSLPGVNCLNFRAEEWAALADRADWNYDVTHRGVRLTRATRLEDFQTDLYTYTSALIPKEGSAGTFAQAVQITLEGAEENT